MELTVSVRVMRHPHRITQSSTRDNSTNIALVNETLIELELLDLREDFSSRKLLLSIVLYTLY
jgi:hypothetical protein